MEKLNCMPTFIRLTVGRGFTNHICLTAGLVPCPRYQQGYVKAGLLCRQEAEKQARDHCCKWVQSRAESFHTTEEQIAGSHLISRSEQFLRKKRLSEKFATVAFYSYGINIVMPDVSHHSGAV